MSDFDEANKAAYQELKKQKKNLEARITRTNTKAENDCFYGRIREEERDNHISQASYKCRPLQRKLIVIEQLMAAHESDGSYNLAKAVTALNERTNFDDVPLPVPGLPGFFY